MLSHEWVGDPSAPHAALFAHGILGSGRNWRSVARRLAAARPDWRILLVDLRCHGGSPSGEPPHTLDACATDLQALATAYGGVDIAVGHSFGGKVVCAWLAQGAPLDQVWVLDSTPGTRDLVRDEVDALGVIEAVQSVPTPCPSRAGAREILAAAGLPTALVSWLLTSLKRDTDGWSWVWDLDGVSALIRDYLARDFLLWAQSDVGADLHWVRAEHSDRWSEEEIGTLAGLDPAHSTTFHLLEDAGHWLHVDNPDGLLKLLLQHWPT